MEEKTCEHPEFEAFVEVSKLIKSDPPHPVTGHYANVRIRCRKCILRFRFLGFNPTDPQFEHPMLNLDGSQLTLYIDPISKE